VRELASVDEQAEKTIRALIKAYNIDAETPVPTSFIDAYNAIIKKLNERKKILGELGGVEKFQAEQNAAYYKSQGINVDVANAGLVAHKKAIFDIAVQYGDISTAIRLINEGLGNQQTILSDNQEYISTYAQLWKYANTTATGYLAQVGQVALDTFRKFEDALVDALMTGKAQFRDFANSVIADLMRIAIRANITAPLAGALGSFLPWTDIGDAMPWLTPGGGRASGGPVYPGFTYDVGEHGIEKFAPMVPGTIIPNGGSTQPLKIEIINPPGQPMEVTQQTQSFDGERAVVTLFLGAVSRNRFGSRNTLQNLVLGT
jgi:hypothetical protein